MAAVPIDEVAAGQVADGEDDPYQVYMLRRPAERASSVVPQLPKQPEMAETRLRYRRISPDGRSGSFGSLGNQFPARFEFPNRRSLLESLTSDDESSSFAVRRKKKDVEKQGKKKKKKRASRAALAAAAEMAAAAAALSPTRRHSFSARVPSLSLSATMDEHGFHSESSTPLSTSPTTPVPGSPMDNGGLALPASPPEFIEAQVHLEEMTSGDVRRNLDTESGFGSDTNDSEVWSMMRRRPSVSADHLMRKDSGRANRKDSGVARRVDSGRARRVDSGRARRSFSNVGKKMDAGKLKRKDSSRAKHVEPRRSVDRKSWRHGVESAEERREDEAMMTSVDGRKIYAPESMTPSMKAHFVLQAEQPVAVSRGREHGEKKKKSKKKSSSSSKESGHSHDREEEAFIRDKELSVSFAHRRYTAEEAAAKQLSAVQKLWHVLAFARLGGRRSKRP